MHSCAWEVLLPSLTTTFQEQEAADTTSPQRRRMENHKIFCTSRAASKLIPTYGIPNKKYPMTLLKPETFQRANNTLVQNLFSGLNNI